MMDKNLQESLVTVIQKATAGVEAGVDFLSAQLPDVIHQLLMWKAVESFLMMILSLVLFGAIVVIWCRAYKFEQKNAKNISTSGTGYFFAGIITCFIGAAAIISFSLTWLQIWIAPKIYLIEYTANLMGKK